MSHNSTECTRTKSDLSGYLDQALPDSRAMAIRWHLESCAHCGAHAEQLRALRRLMRQEARVAPPAELALQVRMAVSHQTAPAFSAWSRVMLHLENFLRPVA